MDIHWYITKQNTYHGHSLVYLKKIPIMDIHWYIKKKTYHGHSLVY